MIKEYLEKTQEDLYKKKVELEQEEHRLDIKIKENIEFINFLQKEEENDYESFTPRNSHPLHTERIKELKEQQEELISVKESVIVKKEELEQEIQQLTNAIKECNSNQVESSMNHEELQEILDKVIKCKNLIHTNIPECKELLNNIEKQIRKIL